MPFGRTAIDGTDWLREEVGNLVREILRCEYGLLCHEEKAALEASTAAAAAAATEDAVNDQEGDGDGVE